MFCVCVAVIVLVLIVAISILMAIIVFRKYRTDRGKSLVQDTIFPRESY